MNPRALYTALGALLTVALAAGLLTGAYALDPGELYDAITRRGAATAQYVLWEVRAPRLVLAGLVGAGLAVVGAALQGLFRNPLADAGLIGISSGAMLFAALAIVAAPALLPASAPAQLVQGLVAGGAFAGGLLATLVVYRVGVRSGRARTGIMLLAGIALTSFAGALTGYLVYRSDDAQLRDLTFWTLGSLGGATWGQVGLLAPAVGFGTVALARVARTLNALGLGEREAALLGLDVERCKRTVVVASALIVGLAIAFTGLIGFVGLVVPHLLRLLVGADFRRLLPASALLGAGFLTLTDTLARTTVAPAELPIGILTALIGAPFFFWLLLRRQQTVPV